MRRSIFEIHDECMNFYIQVYYIIFKQTKNTNFN